MLGRCWIVLLTRSVCAGPYGDSVASDYYLPGAAAADERDDPTGQGQDQVVEAYHHDTVSSLGPEGGPGAGGLGQGTACGAD